MAKKPKNPTIQRHNVAGMVLVSEIALVDYETEMNLKVYELEKQAAAQKREIDALRLQLKNIRSASKQTSFEKSPTTIMREGSICRSLWS